jgi:hypothetical protein
VHKGSILSQYTHCVREKNSCLYSIDYPCICNSSLTYDDMSQIHSQIRTAIRDTIVEINAFINCEINGELDKIAFFKKLYKKLQIVQDKITNIWTDEAIIEQKLQEVDDTIIVLKTEITGLESQLF